MLNTAIILAAGKGDRLKPLTNIKPKPLCTIHDVPLIEHHIINLIHAGFKRVIINHAHLGGQIRRYIHSKKWDIDVYFSPEPPGALETGGGIFNALPLIGNEPFAVINADIFTGYLFSSLKLPENSLAHLVLTPKPAYSEHGDFGLTAEQQLCNINKEYTFTGIACYHPKIFYDKMPGRYSVTPMLRELTSQGKTTGELYKGYWFDTGTLERLTLAQNFKSQSIVK